MKFSINQKDLQESLGFCQNVIERRSTLPILSNVLIQAKDAKLTVTATDPVSYTHLTLPTSR
mgnify:CR=1 FL=1